MSRMLLSVFVLLAVALSAPLLADDQSIDEGIDYRTVDRPERFEPASPGENSVEVVEFFWYGCPHCYHLEPELTKWLARQIDGVQFRRVPAAMNARWSEHARAFFAAEQLGQLDKLHEALFKAMQEERRQVFSEDELVAFAGEQGIDTDAFRAAYESFEVDMQVRKSAELARRYGITGVPTLVVNGAYVTGPSQTGSQERTFAVIDALVAQEKAAGNRNSSSPEEPPSKSSEATD